MLKVTYTWDDYVFIIVIPISRDTFNLENIDTSNKIKSVTVPLAELIDVGSTRLEDIETKTVADFMPFDDIWIDVPLLCALPKGSKVISEAFVLLAAFAMPKFKDE